VGRGQVQGGQGSRMTHDVTGHIWMLEDRRSRDGLLFLGLGEVCELGLDVMEHLPEVLIFLRDGCDRLGYPAQLM